MVIPHIAVLPALLALLLLPCLVAVLASSERRAARRRWSRRPADDVLALRRVDRDLRRDTPLPTVATPSLGQLATDLRRLSHQRHNGLCRESVRWHEAVVRAYDTRLLMACQQLGVDEHLEPLDGMDRELERMRMEGELVAAGLPLR